jgi:hypothetical protein
VYNGRSVVRLIEQPGKGIHRGGLQDVLNLAARA